MDIDMNQGQNKSGSKGHFFDIIWKFFSSVKLAIVLLIIIALVSIIGTVIPQGDRAIDFALNINPTLFRILAALDCFDIYHSILYRTILAFLALNLIVCSVNRFPVSWKLFSYTPKPDRRGPFKDVPEGHSCIIPGDGRDVLKRVENFLRKRYRKVLSKTGPYGTYFFIQKGRYSYFGVYLVHLSILLILVGALIGSVFGFEGYVNVLEGNKTDRVFSARGNKRIDLGFEVRCDRFTVTFYKNGMPKEYKSELTFLSHGKVLKKGVLLVNHPLSFRGITFYQASYGTIPGGKVIIKAVQKDGKTVEMELSKKTPFPIDRHRVLVSLEDVKNDVAGIGPAALISVKSKDNSKGATFWLFKNPDLAAKVLPAPMLASPKFDPSAFSPYTFYLVKVDSIRYTGLQVSKDPGVPVVWAGSIMLLIGLFISFFTSHRRIWIHAEELDNGTRIRVGGISNRDRVGLDRMLTRLTSELCKVGKGGSS